MALISNSSPSCKPGKEIMSRSGYNLVFGMINNVETARTKINCLNFPSSSCCLSKIAHSLHIDDVAGSCKRRREVIVAASPPTEDVAVATDPLTKEALIGYLASGCKPKEKWRIGTEHEKFGFEIQTLRPMKYEQISELLYGISERFDWEKVMEGDYIIGLKQGKQSISLEPGGQFELSGAPLETLHQTCAEVNSHLYQVKAVAEEMGIGFLGIGFQPKWGTQSLSLSLKEKKKTKDMNVLSVLLLPMWVISTSFFSAIVVTDARPDPVVFTILVPLSHSQEAPISQFSSEMNAQSPGTPEVRVEHHEDLNKKILVALIVASALLAVVLIFLVCFWIYLSKNSKKKSKSKSSANSGNAGGLPLKPMVGKLNTSAVIGKKGSAAIFDYRLLEAATNHFQERSISGEGGRGVVYKARLSEKLLAAVKKLDDVNQDAQREFENEVNWLSKIQHQNIVTLLGYCIHGQTQYLVYEMMQNGSLESQLHGPTHGSALTWHLRMKIAVDVARGLEFLHERCNPPLVHRDLKSSNILLDSDFNAKISDFGLAVSAQSTSNVKISGTVGYLAPEYLLDGKLTDKSDVYAFGIVLLELLMGRKPVEKMESTQCRSLVTWAMPQLTDRSKLPNIVDPVIKDTMDLKHLYQVAAVAVLCIQPEPSYRPLITDVLHSLIPLVPVELGGSLRVSEPVPTVGLDPSH